MEEQRITQMRSLKLNYLAIAAAALLPISSIAHELQVDVGYSQVEHAWRGPNNWATFKPDMESIGLTYTHPSGFAVRVGYGALNHTGTTGKYSDFVLEMDYITSLELMYRYTISDLTMYAGVSASIIPASVRAKSITSYDHDYDNDEGWLVGMEYMVYNDISFGYRFNIQSRITSKPYDEWTKSHGIYLAYKF